MTHLPKQVQMVRLSKFRRLKLQQNSLSFNELQSLRVIIIENVAELEIENFSAMRSESLLSDSPKRSTTQTHRSIQIIKTKIDTIPANFLSGNLAEINVTNCTINSIESEAFNKLPNLKNLILVANEIGAIINGAFQDSKTQYLRVGRNTIDDIQDGAFNISVVVEAVVSDNTINHVKSESFNLSSPNAFKLSNNIISNVYRHAFHFKSLKVEIMSNTFHQLLDHAFHYIQPSNNQSPPLYFSKNFIKEFNDEALLFHDTRPTFHLNFLDVKLGFNCSCALRKRLDKIFRLSAPKSRIVDDISSIGDHIKGAIFCSSNGLYIKFENYEAGFCSWADNTTSSPTPQTTQAQVNLVTILVPVVLAVIVVAVIIYFWKRIRERIDQINRRNWVVAVPQTVYKENEIRIVEECAWPIEEVSEFQISRDSFVEQAKVTKILN